MGCSVVFDAPEQYSGRKLLISGERMTSGCYLYTNTMKWGGPYQGEGIADWDKIQLAILIQEEGKGQGHQLVFSGLK